MKYISTRGRAEPVDFVTACLTGLAPDGGLYVPESWPKVEPPAADTPYAEIAANVLSAFAGNSIPKAELQAMCACAYASFSHHAVAPLTQAGPDCWLMELHHGPTLAFKDVAMQIIAQIYDWALGKSGQRMSIVCATSGDTGGAAAAAFANAQHADLYILHPHERVSPVQRLFMTTTGAGNITNLAVDGDFDDCQKIVKSLFADKDFAAEVGLSGVNSINWARIAAQSVYYASAQAQLGGAIRFVVPSGNMGDALAGYVAARCGLLPGGLEIECAVNENDALSRIFETGIMERAPAVATPSPAMDISVPSNFERVLFEASGRNGYEVRGLYDSYAQSGSVALPENVFGALKCMGISASAISNAETLEEMKLFLDETGWLICPHTAVGTAHARRTSSDVKTVVLSTAAAEKFPETVKDATGYDAPLPQRCSALIERGEEFSQIANDVGAVRAAILDSQK